MTKAIVAIYDDIVVAQQVIEDLVKSGVPGITINLITNDSHNQYSRYLDKGYTSRNEAIRAGDGVGAAVVGGLTGTLAELTALTISGIGLSLAAGPMTPSLIEGNTGIIGTLVGSGVTETEASYYAEGIRRGGTLISIQSSNVPQAEDIMNRYGAINIHERVNLWRQTGWTGFDAQPSESADTSISESAINRKTSAIPVRKRTTVRPTSPSAKKESEYFK